MRKQFKFLFISIVSIAGFAFVLFMINQINGIYGLASGVSPLFGQVVLWALILLTAVVVSLPVIIYFRLPKALDQEEAKSDLPAYQEKLVRRLKKNKLLIKNELVPESPSDLAKAIDFLNQEADKEIKSIAGTIFLTTAISQNGKLDALTVLATQSKMVWRLAHIYYQRPTLKDMGRLYSNVAMATFLASEIEDLDISEQFQPVIQAMMRNTASKSIPIVGSTANIIMDSLLEGTTNAFLSLRVGIIAKKYCGSIEAFDKRKAKRRAYVEASEMLGKIVIQSSGKVISSVIQATKNAGVETFKSGVETVKNTGEKVKNSIVNTSKSIFGKKEKEVEEPKAMEEPKAQEG
ncbi:MAG: DUF697 domain-containing protein [Bacteroidota bacterium]